MKNRFYDRTILILEELKGDILLSPFISILESPLDLAKRLICQSFEESGQQLTAYREHIDSIKRMVLGLSSAEKSADIGDRLANYTLYQFAFQQYFQSSLRARQGMILDKALDKLLTDNKINTFPHKLHKEKLNNLGIQTKAKHDIDVFGSWKDKFLIVQIRSRDDTGGTTAKGSLVELIEDINNTGKYPEKTLIYLIYIWEPLNSQQREALINKIGSALNLSDEEKEILRDRNILSTTNNVQLGVMYGAQELFQTIQSLFGISIDTDKYAKVINMLSQWDDLWLSYAIATLELENLLIKGTTNFNILDRVLGEEKIELGKEHLLNYRQSSSDIAHKLALVWKENTIPFPSPSDQLNYIRDLVLLKMAFIAIRGNEK